MTQGRRVKLSSAQRTDMRRRWKAGESLREIGRAFNKSHVSIHFMLSQHGGIVPAVCRRSLRVAAGCVDDKPGGGTPWWPSAVSSH
jgi:hypothetical protein